MTINRPVVTIFEMYGSGAAEVGPAVADALGVPWLPQVYSSEDLEAAEGRGPGEDSLLSRILATLGRTAATSDVGVYSGQLDQLDAEDAVRELRAQMAEGGVVLGRNATMILADEPQALHVKLDGPLEQRIARGAAASGIDLDKARARQARDDTARVGISQRLFTWDPRSNDQFDLVINTGRVPLDRAVQLILQAQRLKAGS
ncbi:MAG: cytidylate kinase-like family protein [Propionibacteriaceae bacterium]|nr:cytidylate kinase-like family protein [Propionibacteriaceae bacterium]